MSYQNEYLKSVDSTEQFWLEQAEQIHWFKKPNQALSKDENGIDRWFSDGELNTCYLAVDHHVEQGRGDRTGLIYDSPVTGKQEQFTYQALLNEVSQLAGMLKEVGVTKGDTVLIYMPMIPQAAFAMLACARLGAIHSVVFGGFAANELAVRIDDAKPKVLLTASCGIEPSHKVEYQPLVQSALSQSQHNIDHLYYWQREEYRIELADNELCWKTHLAQAKPADCTTVQATDPLYILYTSGTTGTPKGIVRDNGGHAVAMKYSMKSIYNINPEDVFWAASDVGWVVGHSYIVYAPLIHGCTSIMFEGKPVGTPDAGAFWRVCEQYKVKALFAAPTAFRAIKKQDSKASLAKQYDLSRLEQIFVAGERLDPPTYHWLNETFERPIIDHWWQTETGWAIAANMTGVERLPTKAGSASVPTPGFNIEILDNEGNNLPTGEQGNIAIKLPLPPSCLPTIWQDFARYQHYYLSPMPGYYLSGDGGYIDEDGYLFVMGRIDDVINVAGHRLSTGRMEEVIGSHEKIAECAVIGTNDELKGQVPITFVILKDGEEISSSQLFKELTDELRKEIGPINCLKSAYIVSRLPKTRSGKILRKVMRQISNGESYIKPSTIDDPNSLDEIKQALATNI